MRITFVLPGAGISGGVRVTERFASALLSRGYEARILHRESRRVAKDVLRDKWLSLRYPNRHNWIRSFAGGICSYTTLTPELVGHNDFVVGIGISCVSDIAALPPECGIKIHNSHGIEPWIKNKMEQVWDLRMPRIVVASYLERAMRARGTDDDIYVVHNGVDSSDYFPDAPPAERNGVGTVFHNGIAKDPDTVRAVLWEIHRRSPQTPLCVFGTARRRALPRGTQYERFPSVASARRRYSRSRVWFCASRWEGFGLPLLEAMACGCAVVSTDCGGPSDFIENGVNGILVPVGVPEAQAEQVLHLLADRRRCDTMAKNALAQADRMTWTRAVDNFEAALQDIKGKQSTRVAGV